jgi:sugar diacid utilization regulator/putative methionine-R-sulfoxide reductase with GAF domain
MTPRRHPPAALRPVDQVDLLDALLCEIPDDAASAAIRVADALSEAWGTPVAVRWESAAHRVESPGTIGAGRVTLTWDPDVHLPADLRTPALQACAWLSLAAERDESRRGADAGAAEAAAVRDVVGRLLSVRDVDQVLLSIANHTVALLDSDICGVLLRDGDEVCMRSCVGNREIETARLRMRRGQGVAGLVFLTGEPAKVDDYLRDRTISQDFMSLAVQEDTRSAMAVPLRLQGEFVGVLEVWRRRPSLFTDRDVRRMVTLADFATIAIDNARLHDEQASAVRKTKQARDALERQVAVLARSSSLQQALLTTVRDGGGLPAVARTVATELSCQVGVYGPQGELTVAHGGKRMTADLPMTLPQRIVAGRSPICLPGRGEVTAWVQPFFADGDQIGSVALLPGEQSVEMMDVVAGQVAMACSLALLRQRAASRARSEAMDQVLWDLVQGPIEHRAAARSRAQQLGISLAGRLRLFSGQIENVEELGAQHGWDTSQINRARRDVVRALREEGRGLSLVSLRGDLVVAVAADIDRAEIKNLLSGLTTRVRDQIAELRLTWGVSRAHSDVMELPGALNEARTALSAAHRLGGQNVFLYEELGIVRLLLGSGDDPDLQAFIDDVTGPLVAYDKENDGSLIRTLRGFFDADCSQRIAAERLFIHHKTLRYRLERIKQLTGLDLARHEDRMRADFALRLLQINGASVDDAVPST